MLKDHKQQQKVRLFSFFSLSNAALRLLVLRPFCSSPRLDLAYLFALLVISSPCSLTPFPRHPHISLTCSFLRTKKRKSPNSNNPARQKRNFSPSKRLSSQRRRPGCNSSRLREHPVPDVVHRSLPSPFVVRATFGWAGAGGGHLGLQRRTRLMLGRRARWRRADITLCSVRC